MSVRVRRELSVCLVIIISPGRKVKQIKFDTVPTRFDTEDRSSTGNWINMYGIAREFSFLTLVKSDEIKSNTCATAAEFSDDTEETPRYEAPTRAAGDLLRDAFRCRRCVIGGTSETSDKKRVGH